MRVVVRHGKGVIFALRSVMARFWRCIGVSILNIHRLQALASSPGIAASRTVVILFLCTAFHSDVTMIIK